MLLVSIPAFHIPTAALPGKVIAFGVLVLVLLSAACKSCPAQNAPPFDRSPSLEAARSLDASPDDLAELKPIESLIAQDDFARAERPLRQYLAEYPGSWRAHYDLGYLLFRIRGGAVPLADRIKESIAELSRSLQLNLKNAQAHKILGLDLTMIQRNDLAQVEYQEAVRLEPQSAENHYFLGRNFMARSDDLNARRELEAAIRLDPAYTKAYENLGVTLDRLGDQKGAVSALKKAIELDKLQPAASEMPYLDLARVYHEANDLENARALALQALDRNPRSCDALIELAEIYRDQRRWPDALDALQKSIALDPDTARPYYLLGLTYRVQGRNTEAQKAFDEFSKRHDAAHHIRDPQLPEPPPHP